SGAPRTRGHGSGASCTRGHGSGASCTRGHGSGASCTRGHGSSVSCTRGHGSGVSCTRGHGSSARLPRGCPDREGDVLMLHATTSAAAKRRQLREALATGELLRFPGAMNPLSARLIAEHGFEGVYVSGAVLAADLGLPDIGRTTLTEVATRAGQIARMSDLPTIVDADTGFGEPMNAARTIQMLEDAGLAGCHIEDQVNPKRCGHL